MKLLSLFAWAAFVLGGFALFLRDLEHGQLLLELIVGFLKRAIHFDLEGVVEQGVVYKVLACTILFDAFCNVFLKLRVSLNSQPQLLMRISLTI